MTTAASNLESLLLEINDATLHEKSDFLALEDLVINDVPEEDTKPFVFMITKQENQHFPPPDLPTLFDTGYLNVEFLNLKYCYEKVQSRINRQSRQRILKARVRMVVTFDSQIQEIEAVVERIPGATILCGDKCGQVSLKVKMEELELNKQYFSVDLDSVYLWKDGSTPVYKLSTVDAERRNRFRLALVIVFIDDSRSNPFYSSHFLLRSKKQGRFRSISY